MAAPPKYPVPGLFLCYVLGTSAAKLVVDETRNAALIQLFTGAIINAPLWFKAFGLVLLVSGVFSNGKMLWDSLTKRPPVAQLLVQLALVFCFVLNVGYTIAVAGPSEKAVAALSGTEMTPLHEQMHTNHLVLVAVGLTLVALWGLLAKVIGTGGQKLHKD